MIGMSFQSFMSRLIILLSVAWVNTDQRKPASFSGRYEYRVTAASHPSSYTAVPLSSCKTYHCVAEQGSLKKLIVADLFKKLTALYGILKLRSVV